MIDWHSSHASCKDSHMIRDKLILQVLSNYILELVHLKLMENVISDVSDVIISGLIFRNSFGILNHQVASLTYIYLQP